MFSAILSDQVKLCMQDAILSDQVKSCMQDILPSACPYVYYFKCGAKGLNAHSLPHAFYDVCISIFLLAISDVTDFSKPEMQQLRRDAFDGHTIWTVPLNCVVHFHWILGTIDFRHRWVRYLDSRPTTLTSSLEHQGPSWAFAVRHMFDQSCLC